MKRVLIIAAAGLAVATASVSHAQPYAIAGDFNSWDNNGTFSPGGGPTIYTNIMTGGTAGAWEGVKVIAVPGSWSTTYPGGNLNLTYDATGSSTLYFYPGNFSDGWLPTQNRVGIVDPGNMAFEVTGDFTSPNWGGGDGSQSDPAAQLAAAGNGLYTNTYVIPTAGTHQFKIRTPGTWSHFQCASDFGGGANAVVTTTSANQAVLFQLDLPNGRMLAGSPPTVCAVTFNVDMTLVAATDPAFNPSSVTVNGDAFGWGGTACTNNPTAANTNVYSAVILIPAATPVQYQFRYLSGGTTVYDALNGSSGVNRTLTVPNSASTNVPPVFFNDAAPNDLLNMDTLVTFSVNMNGAVGTDAHAFDPSADYVFVNGDFTGWLPWNAPSLASYQFNENPPGSGIYTYSMTFPAGHARTLTYKYSINGADNEAGYAVNHFRYIRTTNGVENLPVDTFANMYSEPKFGNLAIGKAAGGYYPLTWLGYPGVYLQNASSLTGPWQTNLTTSAQSSNSWPVSSSGSQFFRLVKP